MPPFTEPGHTPPAAMPDHLIRHATLRQLQVFEAIVRNGSFTRAAQELFLTQPTVSMQVKKLVEAVGMPLFEQVGRAVRPTEAGRVVYEATKGIFQNLSDLETGIAQIQGIKKGRLRLGAITTAKYFAPELLGAFSREYPGIDVALKVSNRERIVERVRSNEDDLYIMGQEPAEVSDLATHPFAPNPLVMLAPHDHPLAGETGLSMARLADEPFLMREPGSGIREATLHVFEQHDLRPKVRMELGSNEAIKHAVVGGLGLAVLSLHTLNLEGPNAHVAILDVEGFPIRRQWCLVHPRQKELSLVAQAFLDFALAAEPGIRARMEEQWPMLLDAPPPSSAR